MMKIYLLPMLFMIGTTVIASELPSETDLCNLPDDFSIQSSDRLPDRFKGYVGVFTGKWESKLQSTLIVESIDEDGEMEGYYSWGIYEPWGISEEGCTAVAGKIKKKLKFKAGSAKVRYKINGDYLTGSYKRGGNKSLGKFYPLQ